MVKGSTGAIQAILKGGILLILLVGMFTLIKSEPASATTEIPLENALGLAKKEGALKRGQLTNLMKVLKEFPKLKDLKLTDVEMVKTLLIGTTSYNDKLFKLIAFSKGPKKTFIALKPEVPMTFGFLFPEHKNNETLKNLEMFEQIELYTTKAANIPSTALPDAAKAILNSFFPAGRYEINLKPEANLFAKIDMTKSGDKVKKMNGFFGLKEETAFQIKGTYKGLMSKTSLPPFMQLTGYFPEAKVKMGSEKKSELTTQMALHLNLGLYVSPSLKTVASASGKLEIGVTGLTKFKIGQQTLDVSLEGAVNAEARTVSDPNDFLKVVELGPLKIARMVGFKATMRMAGDAPWEKAFGIPWLTIENYLVRFGVQGPKVYGGIAGTTTVGEKTVEIAAIASPTGIPEKIRLFVDDGPNKVGSLSVKDFASIFNLISRGATGKDGLSKSIIETLPDTLKVEGQAKGLGPIIDIDAETASVEVQGKLTYRGTEIADVRQGTINLEDGVFIDADAEGLTLGPITLDGTLVAIINSDTQSITMIGDKKTAGIKTSTTTTIARNKLSFATTLDANAALQADYEIIANIAKDSTKPKDMTFGIEGNVSSNLSQWVAETGVQKVQEGLDSLNLEDALAAVITAQEKVDTLQGQIDARKAVVEAGQESNDQALENANAKIAELNNTITLLDDRIDGFKDRVAECNQYKALRKTACKASRQPAVDWANTRRGSVIAAREIAQSLVTAIQNGLAIIPAELDPQLASLYAAKESASAALFIAEKSIEGADKLGDFTTKLIASISNIDFVSIEEGHIAGYIGKGGDEFENPFELDLALNLFGKDLQTQITYSPDQKEALVKHATYMATGVSIMAIDGKDFLSKLVPNKAMTTLENKFLVLSGEREKALKDLIAASKSSITAKTSSFDDYVLKIIRDRNNIKGAEGATEIAAIKDGIADEKEADRLSFITKLLSLQTIKHGMMVTIKSKKSGRCIDTTNDTGNNITVQSYDCNDQFLRQRFLVNEMMEEDGVIGFQLINEKSERCLKIPTPLNKDGTDLVQSNCASTAAGDRNQIWFEKPKGDGFVSLLAFHNSKCLDLEGGKLPNGSKFQQWKCGEGDNQLFSVEEAPELKEIILSDIAKVEVGSVVKFASVVAKKCITSRDAGGAIKTQTCSLGSDNQKFKVTKKVDGNWLQFASVETPDKCLTTVDAENGKDLVATSCVSTAKPARKKQLWQVQMAGNVFLLKNRGSGKCLDLEGGGTANNTPLQQWTCDPQQKNQWLGLIN